MINAVVRMLMGSHVTTGLVEGLPVPKWTGTRRAASRVHHALNRRVTQCRRSHSAGARRATLRPRRHGVCRSAGLVSAGPPADRHAAHAAFTGYCRNRRVRRTLL
jgi:hypothetical protein